MLDHTKLIKPSHLKELCKQYGLTPSKKYGQNFLISETPIKKMLDAADIKKGDRVIEIGSGFGVLTFALLERGALMTAFEIEQRLESYWETYLKDSRFKIKDYGDLKIVWGNALKKITNYELRTTNYKVVANLPYQITSHVLRTLLELKNKPESITVMVQKEVADRIVAKPGDMSLLAVSIQYFGNPKIICKVPRGNFWPMPEVDSAVVHIITRSSYHSITLSPKNHQPIFLDEDFFKVVRAGFANKRKQLWRNLSQQLTLDSGRVKDILIKVVGNEKIRAQDLSVENWRDIVKLILT